MNFAQLEQLCKRAGTNTFSQTKLLISTAVLALCGLLVIFCMGLSKAASTWFVLSLTFLPIFISGAILMGLGVVLIRAYHDEIKKKKISYTLIISKSWDNILSALYIFVPIILLYLLQWVMLGLFILLKEIPILGILFGVILAFAPFLLNLGSLVLCLGSFVLLFAFTPVIALKQLHPQNLLQYAISQLVKRPFMRILLLLIALIPLAATTFILWFAAYLTTTSYMVSESHLQIVLQWFFIMLPFAAFLAPATIFFYNMSCEAHVLAQKGLDKSEGE
jgi:hypothetical protein